MATHFTNQFMWQTCRIPLIKQSIVFLWSTFFVLISCSLAGSLLWRLVINVDFELLAYIVGFLWLLSGIVSLYLKVFPHKN